MRNTTLISPIRKAILIGAAGSGNNRLRGVDNDMVNMCQFLMSPRGGSWYEDEITILDNPSVADVIQEAHGYVNDYQLVYFSGHGGQDAAGNDFVSLRNGHLYDNYLFNAGPRQMLILDSCRKYYHTISGLPKEYEEWASADGYSQAREMFDRYIIESPAGRMKMYATAAGEIALDNRDGKGGEFTLALLKSIYSMEAKEYRAIMPLEALEQAKRNLILEHQEQVPELINVDGALNVPLGITSSNFIRQDTINLRRLQIQAQIERSRRQKANENVIGLGIAAVVLYHLFK